MTLLVRTPVPEESTVPPRGKRLRLQHLRWPVFWILLFFYLVLTAAVIFRSPVLTLDHKLFGLDLYDRAPHLWPAINTYVMLGQRAPATFTALPWIVWRCWRMRSTTPLVRLAVALIVLNLSVGVMKVFVGRNGPLHTPNAHDVFVGGNIYPSGHTANAVVLFGLLAWMAVRHRRAAIAAAVVLSASIGLCTIYLDTHWFSDVVGGWVAGGLVLLLLPTLMPHAERVVDAVAWRCRSLASWPVPPAEKPVVTAGRSPR